MMNPLNRALMPAVIAGAFSWSALAQALGEAVPPASRPPAVRLAERSFPSVFQAWSDVQDPTVTDELAGQARHDLLFHGVGWFGLKWDAAHEGEGTRFTEGGVRAGREKRASLLKLNPRMILIAEIRYRDAYSRYLPADHRWWKRDAAGQRVPGWQDAGADAYLLLDFENPEFQDHVAAQAAAAIGSGVVDGVMLDWWVDDDARIALIQKVRRAIGPDALILANANDNRTPATAPFINGYFMECPFTRTPQEWAKISDTLLWAEANLRAPRINCLETWFHDSREDLHLMRATTTLALTHSDGFCLFSDPNTLPAPDHEHGWYPFWQKRLGKPREKGVRGPDGVWRREFENGTAIYNPAGGKEVTVTRGERALSAATGQTRVVHLVRPGDGDLLLRPASE